MSLKQQYTILALFSSQAVKIKSVFLVVFLLNNQHKVIIFYHKMLLSDIDVYSTQCLGPIF